MLRSNQLSYITVQAQNYKPVYVVLFAQSVFEQGIEFSFGKAKPIDRSFHQAHTNEAPNPISRGHGHQLHRVVPLQGVKKRPKKVVQQRTEQTVEKRQLQQFAQ